MRKLILPLVAGIVLAVESGEAITELETVMDDLRKIVALIEKERVEK